jgi:hypothetical protein
MTASDAITVESAEIAPSVFRATIAFDLNKAPMHSLGRE